MSSKNGMKPRHVLSALNGNVTVGLGGKKGSLADIKHEIASGAVSPKMEPASNASPTEPRPNPRTDAECRDYIDAIHGHFLKNEAQVLVPHDYMKTQPELTADMRSVCLDWIIECGNRFKMAPETLFLTVNVLDRFLAVKPIQRKRMQLVTMVSLIIASKYEEIYPPRIKEFIHISADAFTREDMLRYEHSILHALNYTLTVPTPFSFISRHLIEMRQEGVPETTEQRTLRHATHFVAECAMLNLELYLKHVPSLLAAASVYTARKACDCEPRWPEELARLCSYDLQTDIAPLADQLFENVMSIKQGTLQATVKRYSDEKRSAVTRLFRQSPRACPPASRGGDLTGHMAPLP